MSDLCYHCMQPGVSGGRCRLCGAAVNNARDPEALQPGATLDNGSIVIGELLGRGGFGATYIARDENFGVIALKEFFPKHLSVRSGNDVVPLAARKETYDKCMRDFQREARLIHSLDNHPNVVKVFFAMTENNTCYYGMELLGGCSLSSYLAQKQQLTLKEALTLLDPIMDALSFMHSRQMLHRDISPDNIFLRDTPQGVSPCLIDFGAAYSARKDFTQSMPRVRNMYFSPPDQNYPIEHQGPPMDIYALCATLYYMVSGKPPVSADERIVDGLQLIPVTTHVAHLPEGLWQIINRGMALERAKRYQSIAELQSALHALLPASEAPAHRAAPKPSSEPKPRPAPKTEPKPAPKPVSLPADEKQGPDFKPLLSCLLEWIIFYGTALLCFRFNWIPALISGFLISVLLNTIFIMSGEAATIGQRMLGLSAPVLNPPIFPRLLYCLLRAFVPFALLEELLLLMHVYDKPLAWQLCRESESASVIMDCLVPLDPNLKPCGQAFMMPLGPDHDFVLGRGLEPVPAMAGKVSSLHCVIRQTSTGLVLMNKTPLNNTWINDVKLAHNASHPIVPGDVICLAGQIRFRYECIALSNLSQGKAAAM